MPFPSPPWHLRGSMWLSLFVCREGNSHRPAGLYGVAFVDYAGGTLTYHELLVARLVRGDRLPRVTITDIWVDSVASRDGGRTLWAIPKELGRLQLGTTTRGPARGASWNASVETVPVAAARFIAPRVPTLRAPYAFSVSQAREDGASVITPVRGSARTVPVRAQWDFGADGPLAWLKGRRPLASFVLDDFRMTFGT